MTGRRGFELLILLIVVALASRYWRPNPDLSKSSSSVPPFTVRGLKLGMTRGEVVARLGRPLEEKQDDIYPVFRMPSVVLYYWEIRLVN